MRFWRRASLTAVVLAAAAAPAQAAAPMDLGAGVAPSVVVDRAGTAHVVFDAEGGEVYCRIPRGAHACDLGMSLPLTGDISDTAPTILQRSSDGALLIVQAVKSEDDVGTTYVRSSGDSGATWSAPAAIATGDYGFSSVALAPNGASVYTLSFADDSVRFVNAPFGGGETRVLNIVSAGETPFYGRMTVLPDGRILAVSGDVGSPLHWRMFTGGDPFDINAWSRQGTVSGINEPELVSGPRGTFLFDQRSLAAQRTGSFAAPFAFRSLDTKKLRWRKARTAGADRSVFGGDSTAFQDARGRLHVAASVNVAGSAKCVVYARTGVKSKQWFGKTTVLFHTRSGNRAPRRVRIAAGRTGSGIAVWQDATGHVWAIALHQAKGKYRPRHNQNDRPACTGKR
jgi:cytochrome c5